MKSVHFFIRRLRLAALLMLAMPVAAVAQKIPPLFGDRMVLQRDKPIPVWGTAEPGSEVRVNFRSQSVAGRANAEGKWMVELKPEKAGGPDSLTIEGDERSTTFNDVLVGEVWLASGQSNMVLTLKALGPGFTPDPLPDDAALRIFSVPAKAADAPSAELGGSWGPASVHSSAVAYFFGKKMREELDVPVGILVSALGATSIGGWISEKGADNAPEAKALLVKERKAYVEGYPEACRVYDEALAAWEKAKAEAEAGGQPFGQRKPMQPLSPDLPRNRPFGLYNGMIHPLAPYGLRGILWYQGESDSESFRASVYGSMLRAMIQDWRTRWAQPQLPFLIVQLPAFNNEGMVAVRAAQDAVAREPGNGLAVTLDVGDKGDIHPRRKEPVGERLALLALADVYGLNIPAHSPRATTAELQGSTVHIAFTCDEGASLVFKGAESSSGLEVAGADGKFLPTQVRLDKNSLLVSCPEVPKPEQVRYAWASAPAVTLFDSNSLPASPFLLKMTSSEALK